MTAIATARFPALGTTAVVLVAEPGALDAARAAVEQCVDAVDAACSRFRPDSDLSRVNARPGHAVHVSTVLIAALDAALAAARATDGLVDPTVGRAVRLLGYDRTFTDVEERGPALRIGVERIPGWRAVVVDRSAAPCSCRAGSSWTSEPRPRPGAPTAPLRRPMPPRASGCW